MRCMNQYIRNRVLLLQILYLKFSQKEEGHDTHDCLGNRKAEPDTCHSQKCGNAIGRISTRPRRIEMMNPGTGWSEALK